MKFSILIPHYKTGKMTAYCIHQLQKLKGEHDIDIIVIDNSNGEGTEFIPNDSNVVILNYPTNLMQSHGIAFDYALNNIPISEYFITVESDSFPTQDNWLDYYEQLIDEGYEMAGSKLKLSGGEYIHPAGAMYKKSNWIEAEKLIIQYNELFNYLPSAKNVDGFDTHWMTRDASKFDLKYYPVATSVFHQGMAFNNEKLATYGQRTIASEQGTILIPFGFDSNYSRMGYEPGQWLSYWHYATGLKVKQIPTTTEWMEGRKNQQQAFTLMENGFKHLWGTTAYNGVTDPSVQDITSYKERIMNELYDSIGH